MKIFYLMFAVICLVACQQTVDLDDDEGFCVGDLCFENPADDGDLKVPKKSKKKEDKSEKVDAT